MKCIICGMNINSNNYMLNGYSLIEKNQEKNIKSCPFCGVDQSFLIHSGEIYKVSSNDLTAQEIKVLDHAVKLEVFNGEFYKEASQLAKDKNISNLFSDLSKIEFMHAKIHKNLGGFDLLPTLQKPDYSTRLDSDLLLLDEATKREHHAIEFYKKKSCLVNNPVLLKVFKALSDVEKQHEMIAQNNVNEKQTK